MNTETVRLNITARHMELTEAIKDFIVDKLQHIELDYPRIIHAHVVLEVQKYRNRCEVILVCNGHRHFEARAEMNDMYAAIDACVEKVQHQTQKFKNRSHHGRLELRKRMPAWYREARPVAVLSA